MRRYFLTFLALSIIAILYFTDFFIERRHFSDENLILRQELEDLRVELQRQSVLGLDSSFSRRENAGAAGPYLNATVFSTYPFNIKNQIVLSDGERDGVRPGLAVVIGKNILVGRVKSVFERQSLAETIFDPSFEAPVRIGNQGIDALFQGGSEPKIVLIAKNKSVAVGDLVYSAGSDFPYGLKIGEIAETKENITGAFKEAVLAIPFNPGDLRQVNILVKP